LVQHQSSLHPQLPIIGSATANPDPRHSYKSHGHHGHQAVKQVHIFPTFRPRSFTHRRAIPLAPENSHFTQNSQQPIFTTDTSHRLDPGQTAVVDEHTTTHTTPHATRAVSVLRRPDQRPLTPPTPSTQQSEFGRADVATFLLRGVHLDELLE